MVMIQMLMMRILVVIRITDTPIFIGAYIPLLLQVPDDNTKKLVSKRGTLGTAAKTKYTDTRQVIST